MLSRRLIPLAALLFSVLPGLQADPSDPIRFQPRPRFAFNPQTVTAEERARILKQADQLKADGLTVPEKEGNWIFYYACPAEGAGLTPESESRHVCPVCKQVYTDERTAAAYRTRLYNQLEEHLKILAQAYALSQDPAYADPVHQAMAKLARVWPTLPRHDRWGRTGILAVVGGRRFCQLLDEAVSLINLASVWDLVAEAPGLAPETKTLIETQLFRMPAEEIARLEVFAGSRNNHQTWFNAAYTATGLTLGDESLFKRGLYGTAGLLWQLDHSVTSDGLWYEGTLAYHFYALHAIMKTLEAARAGGVDLSGDPRLKSLWVGPLQMAYPNGQCPVFHDSDPASLSNFKEIFQWGARYFNDPRLAEGSPALLSSTNLAGIGVAVLRRGTGAAASCLMLDYGIHGDSHGHPDKLNMVLYALGRELVLDPGRISYSVPEYKSWCRTTVAHNTLVVGERDQKPDTGRLLFFADSPAAAVALASTEGAYPGATLRRFVLLTDQFLMDICTVRKADPARIDWVLHGRGTLADSAGTGHDLASLGGQDGYQHLTQLKETTGTACRAFTFNLETGLFWRVWAADPPGARVVTGTGIGYTTRDQVPFILRRHDQADSLFVSIFDLSGTGLATNIALLPVTFKGAPTEPWEAAAFRIQTPEKCILVGVDLTDQGDRDLSADQKNFNRWMISESKYCEQTNR